MYSWRPRAGGLPNTKVRKRGIIKQCSPKINLSNSFDGDMHTNHGEFFLYSAAFRHVFVGQMYSFVVYAVNIFKKFEF